MLAAVQHAAELAQRALQRDGPAGYVDSLIGSLELDISKAIVTGWRRQVSLDEGLRLALSTQEI